MLFKGLLMAVPKKDKDLSNSSNYRGITVISIICKLLEMCIRAGIEGTLEKQKIQQCQNSSKM
jgi:hypothetical protein